MQASCSNWRGGRQRQSAEAAAYRGWEADGGEREGVQVRGRSLPQRRVTQVSVYSFDKTNSRIWDSNSNSCQRMDYRRRTVTKWYSVARPRVSSFTDALHHQEPLLDHVVQTVARRWYKEVVDEGGEGVGGPGPSWLLGPSPVGSWTETVSPVPGGRPETAEIYRQWP